MFLRLGAIPGLGSDVVSPARADRKLQGSTSSVRPRTDCMQSTRLKLARLHDVSACMTPQHLRRQAHASCM